jgi:hypothetical protein
VSEFEDKLNEYAREFDEKCHERHVEGEKKYGAGTWLGIDTLQHAMDEVLDLGNYARFTYCKLRMIQDNLATILADRSIAKAKPDYDGFLLGKANVTQTKGIPNV